MSKHTSNSKATDAGKILTNSNASKVQKTLAASILSQTGNEKKTSDHISTLASNVLQSDKYSDATKSLAASALSQS